MTVPDPRWQQSANCRGLDPALFYPEPGESLREAKAVCAGCVCRDACLGYALAHNEKDGVWGGMSGQERRRIRKARRLAMKAGEAA